MVTIQRGGKFLTVTRGAYTTMYAPQGWEEVTSGEIILEKNDVKTEIKNEDTAQRSEKKENLPEKTDEPEIPLSEVPLSEMSVLQLKAYAKQLGVEVNTDSAKVLRSQIKKVLGG